MRADAEATVIRFALGVAAGMFSGYWIGFSVCWSRVVNAPRRRS